MVRQIDFRSRILGILVLRTVCSRTEKRGPVEQWADWEPDLPSREHCLDWCEWVGRAHGLVRGLKVPMGYKD